MRILMSLVVLVVVALVGFVPPAYAEGDGWQKEIDAAREQVEELVAKAEALEDEGRADAARGLRERAHKMELAIEQAIERKRAAEKKTKQDAKSKRTKNKKSGAKKDKQRGQILADLERGVHALKALGRHEDAAHLLEILKAVEADTKAEARHREKDEGAEEAAAWTRRAKLMKIAVRGLVEGERIEQAERLEHGIHAIELALKRRNDDEARRIRKEAPKLEEMRELVALAAEVWADFGHEQQADKLMALVRELRGEHRESNDRDRRDEGAGADRERRAAKSQIEVYRLAMKALAEAERPREMDVLERAIHALEIALEGRRDGEAREIRKTAPNREQIVEILRFASRLYAEWGREDPARKCAAMADKLMRRRGDDDRRVKVTRVRVEREADAARLREVEERLEQIQEQIRRLSGDLERLHRDLDR